MTTFSPFTFVRDIVQDKTYLFNDFSEQYVPFIVNRALSLSPQTLSYAEIANGMAHLPPKMQHDFLFFAIPKQPHRFFKWPKKNSDPELMVVVQKVWKVGPVKALEILKLLNDSDKTELYHIKESLDSNS